MSVEQRLHKLLLMEFLQYELDGLEMGTSYATSKIECYDSMNSVRGWTVDQLLNYHGYNFEVYSRENEIKELYRKYKGEN